MPSGVTNTAKQRQDRPAHHGMNYQGPLNGQGTWTKIEATPW